MFKKVLYATSFVALSSVAAEAQITQLNFEGLQNLEQINTFYNGGTGSLGSVGFNFGVTFSAAALAICPGNLPGCTGNFGNNPTPPNIMFWLEANPIMNVAGGFSGGFSTFYTSLGNTGAVEIWSGLNASGSLLGSINLLALGDGSGDPCTNPGANFCRWASAGTTFAGVAQSVRFTGTANQIGFDNVTFGSANPNIVPEPSTYALMALGLGGVGMMARRRRSLNSQV